MRSDLMTIVLTVLYGLLILPAGLIGRLLGRDGLRLRRPAGRDSYWLAKAPVTDVQSYFMQGHPRQRPDGRTDAAPRGSGGLAVSACLALAKLFAPRRRTTRQTATSAVPREQGIPDEIYTLW